MAVLMPRLLDACQSNAQNLNAKALAPYLAGLPGGVVGLSYWDPSPELAALNNLRIKRLVHGRAWTAHLTMCYLGRYDVVFYPGASAADLRGIGLMDRIRPGTRVIATVEGLVGDEAREVEYSVAAGHPVFCQHVDRSTLRRCDALYKRADHIVAISPFLRRMSEERYQKTVDLIPLGVEDGFSPPAVPRTVSERLVVVGIGSVEHHKRPQIFIDLALGRPDADFVWYGEGSLRRELVAQTRDRGIANLSFPGAVDHALLPAALGAAHILVLPSRNEGVPKVLLEAAASAVPVIAFGFYEPPIVSHDETGFLVWDDGELRSRLDRLLDNRRLRAEMGEKASRLAENMRWSELGPIWADYVGRVAG